MRWRFAKGKKTKVKNAKEKKYQKIKESKGMRVKREEERLIYMCSARVIEEYNNVKWE